MGLITALTVQTCDTLPRECGSHVQPMEPGPESSLSDFDTEALTCQRKDSGDATRGCPRGSHDNLCMSDVALCPGAPWPSAPILPDPEAAPGCRALLCANSSGMWGEGGRLPSSLTEEAHL